MSILNCAYDMYTTPYYSYCRPSADVFSNVDDWPDASTLLPLLALNRTNPASTTSVPLRPLQSVSVSCHNTNSPPSILQTRTNESYPSKHPSVSFDAPATQPSTVESFNVACALVQSMAALTNDTDPLPSGSIVNTECSSGFPELTYTNQTNDVSQNELLISDLLLEDDLHFIALTSNASEEKQIEKHLDTSNDSVSLTSGQLHSTSDYDSENRSFTGGSLPSMTYNNQQYLTLKSCSDFSEKYAYSMTGGKLNFSKKLNYCPTNAFGINSSSFLHHNHSYHLPFVHDDSQYRPSIKEKIRSFSEEDSSNKDEKRAKELKLPISIQDIINLAIDEYNERLSKFELTDAQLSLIRDIRRRGKNKVAAQNCRKRKMDQISSLQQDLGFLENEKMQLKSKQNFLIQEKRCFEDKYGQLYDFLFQNSNLKPPNPPNNFLLLRRSKILLSTNAVGNQGDSELRSSRTRRKLKK